MGSLSVCSSRSGSGNVVQDPFETLFLLTGVLAYYSPHLYRAPPRGEGS